MYAVNSGSNPVSDLGFIPSIFRFRFDNQVRIKQLLEAQGVSL